MRAIERMVPRHGAVQDHDAARGHVASLLEELDSQAGDPRSSLAAHLLVTGSSHYRQVFGKLLRGQYLSGSEKRSLLVGADGGYVVPPMIDPTIVPSSNPTRNPLRALATVVRTQQNTWKGVKSGAVAGGYGPEGSEVVDGSPTLAQPVIECARGTAYIPSAIELDQDLGSLEPALAGILQRAKDDAEATKFLNGDGEDEPKGLLTALGEDAEVETAEKGKLAIGDVEELESELDDDFLSNAQFLGHRQVYKQLRKADAKGGAGFWVKLPGSRPELIDYAANYCGPMAGEVKASAQVLVLGDFANFVIADRIDLGIRVITPAEMGRPSGTVGVLALWRNGSAVADGNAFRVLTVKADVESE